MSLAEGLSLLMARLQCYSRFCLSPLNLTVVLQASWVVVLVCQTAQPTCTQKQEYVTDSKA